MNNDRPFWQDFAFKILEAAGVDCHKCPVSEIKINVFGRTRVPQIMVTFEPFEHHELRPFVEIFQAVEWKNTRDQKPEEIKAPEIRIENYVAEISDEKRQELYEILHRDFNCKIYPR